MSGDAFRAFREKVERDPSLRAELRAAGAESGLSMEALAAYAARLGYHFDPYEAGAELSEAQLDAVAGGVDTTRPTFLASDRLLNSSPPSPVGLDAQLAYLSSSGQILLKG